MTAKAQLWIIDDDDSIRWVLEKAFADSRYSVRCFANSEDFLESLKHDVPAVVLSDIRMPGENGLALLDRLRKAQPQLPVVVMTAHSDLETTVKAFQGGAFEYLAKPFDIDEAITAVDRALQHAKQDASLPIENEDNSVPELIGEAAPMQDVFRAIGRLSGSSVSVLLTGETGTGKEVVARALHKHSPRADKPFIALNMAAIPADLIESELFGHERGAFTGADRKRVGRFEQADGGTLFLDEIGDMPLPVQTRLLRVLAEGQFYPVGAHQPMTVDVRVIAATHRELEKLVNEGKFRDDLYHRLNVIRLRLPPLRERSEDIDTLTKHFLKKSAEELNVTPKAVLNEALRKLQDYTWPGNVRQLENTCRWLTVMAPGQQIGVDDLPEDISLPTSPAVSRASDERTWLSDVQAELEQQSLGSQDVLQSYQQQLERVALQTALKRFSGHKQKAAAWLGWGRNTLTRKLKTLLK